MTYYFECITNYDRESLRAFAKYHYRHVAPAAPIFLLCLGVLFLVPGFLGIWGIWDISRGCGILRIAMGAVFLALGVNLFRGRFAASVQEEENRIRFFDDRVEYAGRQQQGYYTYDQVLRLGENNEYFFLYVGKNRALLVDKAGMTLGEPERLRQFLCQKVLPRVG